MLKKISQIIGEIFLLSPILLTSIFFDMWFECILITILLFVYKPMYKCQYHADKNCVCIVLSYATMICCLAVSYTFRKQYLVILLLCNAIAFISSKIGELKSGSDKYLLIEQPYDRLVRFYSNATREIDIDKCTKEEFMILCGRANIPDYKIDELYDLYHMSTRDYCNKYHMQSQSVRNKRAGYRKKLAK